MPHRVEPMRPAYFRRVVIDMILRGGPVSRMQQVATTRHDVNGESSDWLPQASKTSGNISLHNICRGSRCWNETWEQNKIINKTKLDITIEK